jgi:hypothetical protein
LFVEYPISSLNIIKDEIIIKVGDSHQVNIEIQPKESLGSQLLWRTSDSRAASIEDGKIVGIMRGSTEIAVESNSGRKDTAKIIVQQKSPVSIIDYRYRIDSVSGVEWLFSLRNNTKNSINYVSIKLLCFNAVGDAIYDKITGNNYHGVKFTGPLAPGKTSIRMKTSSRFYNSSFSTSIITMIKVEYEDGTTEELLDRDFLYYFDYLIN